MVDTIDGNIYPLKFRLHDNRYANSPKNVTVGGGALRSNILAIGEPAFDPVSYVLSIGVLGTRGLSVISGDFEGNLRVDKTPIADSRGNKITYNTMYGEGNAVLSVGYRKVTVGPAFMVQNTLGVDIVKVGHGHMKALAALVNNIQSALKNALTDTLTNADIDKLFIPLDSIDLINRDHQFSRVYGTIANVMAASENFSTNAAAPNVSITNDADLSPSGKLTADRIASTISTATADTCYVRKTAAITANNKYSGSVFIKQGTSPLTTLLVKVSGGAYAVEQVVVTVNWSTMGVSVVGTNSNWNGGLLDCGDGYYRIWGSGPSYNHNLLTMQLYVNDQSTAHVIGEYVTAWGAMVNKGFVPETYIKT